MRTSLIVSLVLTAAASAEYTRNIMVTGYWNPTNEMVRHFSNNEVQNPNGWQGENWEGRGYNIYSYFPEFPAGSGNKGVGDFEVDYQDTSDDFWRITAEVKPVAIITFSLGGFNDWWEIEARAANRQFWVSDYQAPLQPTPSPPDSSVPVNHLRESSLPMNDIFDRVGDLGLGVTPRIDFATGGNFLSEYMSYHGLWYNSLHNDPSDPAYNVAAGHVHVGRQVTLPDAILATNETVRSVIDHVNDVLGAPRPFSFGGDIVPPDAYGPVPAPSSLLALAGTALLIARRKR